MPNVKVVTRDPAASLSERLGQLTESAHTRVFDLVGVLRELDKVREQLEEHGITVQVDLGPIGNAAAAARRDLDRRDESPKFSLPR